MPPRDIFLALVVIVSWGVNFTAMRFALDEIPPFLLVGLRFALLIPLIAVFPRPAPWRVIIAIGAFLSIGQFGFLFRAMDADITAGLASLLMQSQAPITVCLAFLVYGEKINPLQMAGIGLSTLGLGVFAFASGENVTPLGVFLVLCGALSWACGNMVLRKMRQVNMVALFAWSSIVAPVPMLVASIIWEGPAPLATIAAISAPTWASLVYLALISTLLGFSLWGALLARHPAAQVTPYALLIPVVGIGVASLVLGETIAPLEGIAAGIIFAGLILSAFGARSSRAAAPHPKDQING
jgi:O-acetylserine/cysteine efflux transporter